jgi:hypothetical protein
MDRESILGDLKKYAGALAGAQKITLDEIKPEVVPVVAPQTRGRPRKRIDVPVDPPVEIPAPVVPAITYADIAAMVKPPFKVMAKTTTDNARMYVECSTGHENLLFIKDIMTGNIECRTCKHGTKFTNMVRESIESILHVPFTLEFGTTRNRINSCEYVNEEHMIAVECVKSALTNPVPPEIIGDKLLVTIGSTTSQKRIRTILLEALRAHKNWFVEEIQALIDAETAPVKAAKREPAKPFIRDPVPYTEEAAEVALSTRQLGNPLLVRMNMTILSNEDLCIENCKN